MIDLLTRITAAFGFTNPNQPRIPKLQTIRILMKSGNQITLDRVAECDWGWTGSNVTRLHIAQRTDAEVRLFVSTIDLTQIEAILAIKA